MVNLPDVDGIIDNIIAFFDRWYENRGLYLLLGLLLLFFFWVMFSSFR